MFVSVPSIYSSSKSSCKMPHKADRCAKTENEIYDNEEYSSLEVLVLFVFIKIICVDSEERHSKATSTNGRIF